MKTNKNMTQEEKDLLLKDLCARLPYGVICHWSTVSELTLNLTENNGLLTSINKVNIEGSNESYWDCYFDCNGSNGNSFQNEDIQIEIVKPYLRSMSSMTKLEIDDFKATTGVFTYYPGHKIYDYIPMFDNDNTPFSTFDDDKVFYQVKPDHVISCINWLNAHHFDYRGLIEKGLALEAHKVMYNFNTKTK